MNEEDFKRVLAGMGDLHASEILSSSPPLAAEDSAETTAADGDEGAASGRVVSSTVPSGYTIEYCSEPRWYKIDGVEVPSVTTVLDILHKPALTWWGMKVGVDGMSELICEHNLLGEGWQAFPSVEEIVERLTKHKLTVNHVKREAGTRGTNVHKALEAWATTGQLVDPDDFPGEERGYVQGVNAFLADCKGKLEPLDSELMVGSKEFGFAGRFDLRATSFGMELKPTPRKTRILPQGDGILDLKTRSKFQKRESEPLQLSGYRLGLEEGYGIRSDFECIVQVTPDGQYDITMNDKRPEHFLAVKRAWEALR